MTRTVFVVLTILTTGCLATSPEEEPVLDGPDAPPAATADQLQQALEVIRPLQRQGEMPQVISYIDQCLRDAPTASAGPGGVQDAAGAR